MAKESTGTKTDKPGTLGTMGRLWKTASRSTRGSETPEHNISGSSGSNGDPMGVGLPEPVLEVIAWYTIRSREPMKIEFSWQAYELAISTAYNLSLMPKEDDIFDIQVRDSWGTNLAHFLARWTYTTERDWKMIRRYLANRARRRKNRRSEPQEALRVALNDVANNVLESLKHYPIKVDHTIKKIIPEPRTATFRIERQDGADFQIARVDLSYRSVMPIQFPLEWVTGRVEDLGQRITVKMYLEYEPERRY